MHDELPKRSGKAPWTRMSILAAAILTAGALAFLLFKPKSPCTILVEGRPVVILESRDAAREVLRMVRVSQARGAPAVSTRFVQTVTLRKASDDAEFTDIPEAAKAIGERVAVEAELFAINVDDKPLVALATKEDAEKALKLVKSRYEGRIRNLYAPSTFKEQVYADKRYVNGRIFRASPEEAAEFLTSITEKPTIHTLKPGDRAAKLAMHYGVPLKEIQKLNPQTDLNRLVEGDQLLIRTGRAPVTVVSKALVTKTTTINPPVEGRRARIGKRHTRLLVTYENGKQVSEEVLSQITVWEGQPGPSASGQRSRRWRR